MYSYNDRQNKNNPIWDGNTRFESFALTGAAQSITGTLNFGNPSYIIISNNGANNVVISPDATVTAGVGVLLSPGATFETPVGDNASINVFGTAGQTIFLVLYQ
tara:strand:- start:15 stop:326 length:312 start_codon:yes stop_codon:yes gene_type:complete